MNEEGEMLYCVGCGRAVARAVYGKTLAIACICGANAPILYAEGSSVIDISDALVNRVWATPLSLLQGTIQGVSIPHLEYYLGFSEYQSPLKTEITRMLRALGSISYTECSEAICRESFERSKQRYMEMQGRRPIKGDPWCPPGEYAGDD